MARIKAPAEDMQPYYDYLEDLRQSGKTNMFGARPYLMKKFSLGENEAGDILMDWMKGHDDPARRLPNG